MKLFSFLNILLLVGIVALFSSCFNDLDTVPLDKDELISENVYSNEDSYKQVLAKLYAGLAVTGQQGPAGQPDISGIDEGFGQYLRMYWYHQELTSDEALIGWNDQTIKDLHEQDWAANDVFISALYARLFVQISLCNEFIRETTQDKLNSRGISAAAQADIAVYRAEARFLRALSYWHALDMFRNVPFVTEEDAVGSDFPTQTTPEELFVYIENELKEIEPQLAAPGTNEYGRADQAAVWMVLAKLYLNSEIYVGKGEYTNCLEYCQKVINAGYTLDPVYANMFKADNHKSPEIIFPVTFDGRWTQTYGGTTFIVHAAVGGDMDPSEFGVNGGWAGLRTTSTFVEKFPTGGGGAIVEPNPGSTYPYIYVPGAYQGWIPETANQLASVNDDGNYEGYVYFTEGNLTFKFTPNPDWSADWGDDGGDGTLEPGGDDISVPEAGFYKINVDLNTLTYTLEKTVWGLIGDATPDDWASDQDMTWDPDENAWVISIDLTAGNVKFRANNDWPLNYGDNGSDGILEQDGGDIAIPFDGFYTVKLYLDKPDYTYSIELPEKDDRAMFYTEGQTLEIEDVSQFTNGYAITKWSNLTSDGQQGSDDEFVDTDYPMFRLADAYLMYAEAAVRGGGDVGAALNYVNLVRERAGATTLDNASELTLEFLIDERARELYWEGHRRTDLVRFQRFSQTSYVWPWKGGVPEGASTDIKYNIFPIPASEIAANPGLNQNPDY